MQNALQVLFIVVLTVLNGAFSMSETAVVSARRVRLQQRADAGDERAQAALELVRQPDRFLSTVQIFITLIGIFAGAFGGSQLSDELGVWLAGLGVPTSISKPLALGLVVTGITYVSLVIGELVPKSLALNDAEAIAARVAKPMRLLSTAASPLVSLLSLSTRGILKVLGVRESSEPAVTEDEIKILIAQGTRAGVFAEEEREIVERVFRLGDRRVSALMTPRREIVFLDVEDPWEENRERIAAAKRSAFPIVEGSLDNIVGVAVLKQIWEQGATGAPVDLRAAAQRPVYVLETTRALQVLDAFKGARQHIALVVDEYGNVVGLVTLHDVLEAVMGDVPMSSDTQDLPAVQREDGSWLFDGMLNVDDMLRMLDVKVRPEDVADYTTLGGFVMARLGRIPVVGDHFHWEGLRFEVLDMDGHRVDRVLAGPAPEIPAVTDKREDTASDAPE
jgi:Hemolysins and related proteins containing CBS domains